MNREIVAVCFWDSWKNSPTIPFVLSNHLHSWISKCHLSDPVYQWLGLSKNEFLWKVTRDKTIRSRRAPRGECRLQCPFSNGRWYQQMAFFFLSKFESLGKIKQEDNDGAGRFHTTVRRWRHEKTAGDPTETVGQASVAAMTTDFFSNGWRLVCWKRLTRSCLKWDFHANSECYDRIDGKSNVLINLGPVATLLDGPVSTWVA